MKKLMVVFGVVAICVVVCVLYLYSRVEPGEVRIAGIYPLTGRASTFGISAKNGVELAVEEINAAGGVDGVPIVHMEADTQTDVKLAVSAYQKAISVDNVQASIGFVSSGEAMACAPLAERYESVMITPVAGTAELRTAGEYVFRTREDSALQAKALAEYAHNTMRVKRVAIFYENAANAIAYSEAFSAAFGGEVVARLTYEQDTHDFKPMLLQLKKGPAVDAVYAPGISTQIGMIRMILRQAAEVGLDTQWLSSAGIEDPKLFELAGDRAEGVIYVASSFYVDSAHPRTRAFVESYRKRFNDEPSVYAANAYDTVYLLAEAWQDGVLSGEALVKALYRIKDHDGASGMITFDEYGEVLKPSVVKIIRDGKFSHLDSE
ncbi:MAG: ABC transporter substrate-binding protein [Candidatus Nealsonbacteria bacterium]|nr:ABC transporter substrate-binding protein [Candidatus Nealsonbacteria bacterium]